MNYAEDKDGMVVSAWSPQAPYRAKCIRCRGTLSLRSSILSSIAPNGIAPHYSHSGSSCGWGKREDEAIRQALLKATEYKPFGCLVH